MPQGLSRDWLLTCSDICELHRGGGWHCEVRRKRCGIGESHNFADNQKRWGGKLR
jgi:hypothetical protein